MSLLAQDRLTAPSHPADSDPCPQEGERTGAPSPPGEASIADLFSRGNYAVLARCGPGDDWRTYAALGLIGKTKEALEGLGRFGEGEAAFYAAVARWVGGEEDEDVPRALERLDHPHARNLLALLRKPRIEVLSQWPSVRAGCADLLSGAMHDDRFAVRNISFHPDDLPNRPYADIHQFYDEARVPDFYACAMVEWHLIPPNIRELPCPILGQTGDYDLHIQALYPWLQLFDELLVTDGSEWEDVSRLVRVPVSTFPKSFVLPAGIPPLGETARELDVYLSGSVFHPYHLDKGELLGQLLAIPGLRVHLLNGFQEPQEYYGHLANAKLGITYVRHPQALPTRGLEALAMGCATLVQRGSVLTLFAGEEEGVLEYELGEGDLAQRVQQVLDHWPEFARRARKGAQSIRGQFTARRVASQYLRFLTFLATRPRGPRARHNAPGMQKRMILEKGWLPSRDLVGSKLLRTLAIQSREQLRPLLDRGATSPHPLLDTAREAVLAYHHSIQAGQGPGEEWLGAVRDLYKEAQSLFPRALVPRFNHIRVMLHYGPPAVVSEALELLDETLGFPMERWQADAMEDVFPWDFFPHFFNYRGYFDRVIGHLMHGKEEGPRFCRLMLASLYSYRGFFPRHNGFYCRSLDDFRHASDLDPSFPYYGLWYAKQLIERGLPHDVAGAKRILQDLANGSVPLIEANELLMVLDQDKKACLVDRERVQVDVIEPASALRFGAPQPSRRMSRRMSTTPQPESPLSLLPTGMPARLRSLQQEVEALRKVIQAMEHSKFWIARKAWVRLKRFLCWNSKE